jgi:heterodisulfide reductase subunit B2
MCKTLDVKLTQIPDWNCCGASVSYAESGELARNVIIARKFALAEQNLPGHDVVSTGAACWLNARESKEKPDASAGLMADTNEALKEADLADEGETDVRHVVEVLIESRLRRARETRSTRRTSTRNAEPGSTLR